MTDSKFAGSSSVEGHRDGGAPLETSFSSVKEIVRALTGLGCEQAFVKLLAKNQDNEKNQIFIGSSSAVVDFFPGVTSVRSAPSQSSKKSHSQSGGNIPESLIDLSWIWPDGQPCPAPAAKMINYYQYPEVRLSGFLKGCERAPQALRRERMDAYGQRMLILGIAGEQIFGIVVTDVDGSSVVNELLSLSAWPVSPVFRVLPLPAGLGTFDRNALERELRAILGREYESLELRKLEEGPVPARSSRGAGYTLEALLGIPQNSTSGPDKHGFEIKAVGGQKVTIITTEPNTGYRHDEGFRKYMARFGWPAKTKPGFQVFNGYHKFGVLCVGSGATLGITNWDNQSKSATWVESPEIQIVHQTSGIVISGWTYDHLKDHWGKKHSGAVYVEATSIKKDSGRYPSHFIFGPRIAFGTGTSPAYLLREVAEQRIALDPADEINPSGRTKARTQWRVPGKFHSTTMNPFKETQLTARLATLYDEMEVIDIRVGQPDANWLFQQGLYVPSSS
jgi:hypothetical protein